MSAPRNPPPDFRVPFRAVAFPEGAVPYSGDLSFSEDDLAHALFTTGRAPGDEISHGRSSVYEWLHRTSLIPAYVRRTYWAGLVRSDLALTLDRSELVGVSYALGQAMAAIFCRTQLGVSHLLHIDRYSGQYNVRFGQTRRRSDLFGTSARGWVVAEAKGRSGSLPEELRRTLEAQKRSVSEIEGKPPWVALGCVAFFPQRAGAMQLRAFDPSKEAEEPIVLDVTRDRFVLAYYLPFLRVFDFGNQEQDEVFQSATFANFGLRVKLPLVLVERLRRAESGQLEGLSRDVQGALNEVHSRELGVFPDGSVMETDWQSSIERQDWSGFE
jgi:hypothetical protein